MLSDHTTYWDNLDGFVLRIVRVCAETAKSPWQRKLPDTTQMSFGDRLAKWRVGFLRWAVRINTLFWLLAFSLLWWRHEARVPLPIDLPGLAPGVGADCCASCHARVHDGGGRVGHGRPHALAMEPLGAGGAGAVARSQESDRHGVGLVGARLHRDSNRSARVLGLAGGHEYEPETERTAGPAGRPARRDDDRGLQFRGDRVLAQAATGAASRLTNSAMMLVGRSTKLCDCGDLVGEFHDFMSPPGNFRT